MKCELISKIVIIKSILVKRSFIFQKAVLCNMSDWCLYSFTHLELQSSEVSVSFGVGYGEKVNGEKTKFVVIPVVECLWMMEVVKGGKSSPSFLFFEKKN